MKKCGIWDGRCTRPWKGRTIQLESCKRHCFLGDITPENVFQPRVHTLRKHFNELKTRAELINWLFYQILPLNNLVSQKKTSATRRSISESISHFCVSAPWELRGGNLAMGRKPQWGNLSWHLTDPHRHRPSFFIAFLVLETCSANLFGLGVKGGDWRLCLFNIRIWFKNLWNVWQMFEQFVRSLRANKNYTSRSFTPWKSLANWCPKWCHMFKGDTTFPRLIIFDIHSSDFGGVHPVICIVHSEGCHCGIPRDCHAKCCCYLSWMYWLAMNLHLNEHLPNWKFS